ncbi:hypothetical protein NSB25_20855 [Acetatifactor muris]|uniref:Uncharacterized protein n=1 Tax=Acetatifactor muris TaxID=879566 RepID=A0A2K4ZM37_9FIRM|nr:hypothetical protein [Acetatifactor muris]MCR2049709.1 hypothetical protein [Acetatifactor muris]SOY31486.1 hypothetical protein AMURIS_04230 [Acetatifactor muris]
MQKTVYEDYKYSMQDTGNIYVGCKYTFGELLEQEDILFKFRLIMQHYILPEASPEDTLETHLYYLAPESFLVKIYRQMKAKVKVNVIEEKKFLFGRKQNGPGKKRYVTRMLTVEQLVNVPPAEKEKQGYVIQELRVSKLALATLT